MHYSNSAYHFPFSSALLLFLKILCSFFRGILFLPNFRDRKQKNCCMGEGVWGTPESCNPGDGEWAEEFICPISKKAMADPVIIASGQTFERTCIEAWFKLGQTTCPKDGAPLENLSLIPNVALRKAMLKIKQFPKPVAPPSPDFALKLAKQHLAESSLNIAAWSANLTELLKALQNNKITEQEQAALELRKLTRIGAEQRRNLCEHPHLLSTVSTALLRSRHASVHANLIAAIVNLSIESENKLTIVRAGLLPPLIEALKGVHPDVQEQAAGALFSLAMSEANRIVIGVLGSIPPLLKILTSLDSKQEAKQDAAMALYHLSFARANLSKLVKAGAAQTLINLLLGEKNLLIASKVLLILCNIGSALEGRAALLESGAVNALVNLVGLLLYGKVKAKVNTEVEHTLTVLLLLSKHRLRFKALAIEAGLTELLLALLNNDDDNGSSSSPTSSSTAIARVKSKALALLAIMKQTSPLHSSSLSCDSEFSSFDSVSIPSSASSSSSFKAISEESPDQGMAQF